MSRCGLAVLSSFLLYALAPRVLGQGAWFELEASQQQPSGQLGFPTAMAFDESRGVVVLVGRIFGKNAAETWEWDGSSWSQKHSTLEPDNVEALAYDPKHKQCIAWVTHGEAGPKYSNELWRWDGKAWTVEKVDSGKGPSVRDGPAFAFDRDRGVIVLMGGLTPIGYVTLDDTWEYDGSSWRSIDVKVKPGARSEPFCAYDPATKKVVLFSGRTNPGGLVDTWEYDGRSWAQRSTQPPSGFQPVQFGRLVSCGASGVRLIWTRFMSTPVPFLEIAAWNGTSWTLQKPLSPGVKPVVQSCNPTWDPVRRAIFCLCQSQASASESQQFVYLEGQPASFQVVGKGCPGSTTGVPVLGAPQPPVLGKSMELSLSGAPILRPTFLVLADLGADVDLGFLGAPGCRAYTQPQFFFGLVTDFRGQWAINPNFALPRSAALFNAELHAQAWVFDAKANALGLFGSNGGKLTLGF